MPVASVLRQTNISRPSMSESPRRRYVRSKVFVPSVGLRDDYVGVEATEFKGSRRTKGSTQTVTARQLQILNLMHAYLPSVHLKAKYSRKNGATEIVIQKESKEDFVSRYHPFVKDAGKLTVGAQVAPSQGVTGRSNDARTNNKSRHISKVPRKTSNSKQGRPQDFGPSHSTSGQSSDSSRLSVPGIGLSDARKSLSVLPEEEMQQLNESLDLKDEETWSGYSSEEIPLRFKQYRTLALNRISELEDELDVTIRKTCTQVDSLKQQFQDQRHKWEAVRRN